MEQKEMAARLEAIAREMMEFDTENTLFDAHHIQQGSFAEAMLLLLRKKSNYREAVFVDWFIRKLTPYLHCKPEQIPSNAVQQLFEDFLSLITAFGQKGF